MVTGTPIQRSVDDLYGLLLLLGQEPYWVHMWWNRCLLYPFKHGNMEPMIRAMAPILWRNQKKDVWKQMGVPNQTEIIHWLEFTPIEDHFYRRTLEECHVQSREVN